MLTGSIYVDLSGDDAADHVARDRHAISRARLDDAPDGTRVIVLAGRRRWALDPYVLETLHTESGRLNIDIRGADGETIAAWHRAIKSGRAGVVV